MGLRSEICEERVDPEVDSFLDLVGFPSEVLFVGGALDFGTLEDKSEEGPDIRDFFLGCASASESGAVSAGRLRVGCESVDLGRAKNADLRCFCS